MNEESNLMDIQVFATNTVNYALQQNRIPVVQKISILSHTEQTIENASLRIESNPAFTAPYLKAINVIPGNTEIVLSDIRLDFDIDFLAELTERISGTLIFTLAQGEATLSQAKREIALLAYDEWHGSSFDPELLTAFVMPNHPEVVKITSRASELLEKWTGSPSLDAYQTQNPNHICSQAAAVYGALQELNIVYSVPPASFETTGQRVRLCDSVIQQKMGTCLDLTLIYAACLESLGLHPLLLLKKGHIFAGVWLEDMTFQEAVQDDVSLLTKRIAGGINEIAVVECTAFVAGKNINFEQAMAIGEHNLADIENFQYIIDVARSRLSGIRPLPLRVHDPNGWHIERECREESELTQAPSDLTDKVIVSEGEPISKSGKVEQWERKLLDLGLRNTLINMRITPNVIPILSVSLDALEDALSDGGDFGITYHPAEWTIPEEKRRNIEAYSNLNSCDRLIVSEFQNRRLRAGLGERDLSKAITGLYRTAKTSLEENGANTLYLALGMLRWFENKNSQRARYAPIVLLPIEMVRKSANLGYIIRLRDEDPQMNITLLEMLKRDFGIAISGLDPLPQDEHGIDLRTVFSVLRHGVMGQPHWDVIENAFLGIFSFSQFVMWNDVRNRMDDLLKNKIVRSLIDGRLSWDAEPMELGESVPEGQVLLPIPADASQLYAIESAAQGKSFVLHGPPGTGKSQTITALITNALAQGKSVLFVAEKMAALSVVQRRLEEIGIGPFCLELHSNKSKKKNVLDQLEQAANIVQLQSPEEFQRDAEQAMNLREELNAYADALHKKQHSGYSLYEMVNEYERHAVAQNPVHFSEEFAAEISAQKADQQKICVERLIAAGKAVGHPSQHPLSAIRSTAYSQTLRAELPQMVEKYHLALRQLEQVGRSITVAWDQELPTSETAWKELLQIGQNLSMLEQLPCELVRGDEVLRTLQDLQSMAGHFLYADQIQNDLLATWDEGTFKIDVAALQTRWNAATAKWILPRMLEQNRIWKSVSQFAKTGDKRSVPELLAKLQKYREEKAAADSLRRTLTDCAERLIAQHSENWNSILQLSEQAAEGAKKLCTLPDGEKLRKRLAGQVPGLSHITELQNALTEVDTAGNALRQKFNIAQDTDGDWLVSQKQLCRNLTEHISELREWIAWRCACEEADKSDLGAIVHAYEAGLAHEKVLDAYLQAFHEVLINETVREEPVLNTFSGAIFDEKIEQFKRLDQRLTKLNRDVAYCRLAANVPNFSREATHSSEVGILQRAIRSGGRGVSIRRLFEQIPNLLLKLCPCMLMSPMSAAQYLDPQRPPFDLVVFDEASQLPTFKAIGALARGENAVIVGDPKQMPPTSFFTSNTVDEDHLESEDLESILDDCLALNMPQTHLLWHYRSRHESLIAFSNRQFYENALYTFPSVNDLVSSVSLVHVDGFFDRGRSRQNQAEAVKIVEELVRRCHDPRCKDQSVGVVTFNISQQNLIDDLLTDACAQDSVLEDWAYHSKEPIFIKNLENVQGDERDVILFSIGYGPDQSGVVTMNFGPLNRDGGWRRLNVAVSRARQEMVVFATLRPEQIDLSRSSAQGVSALRAFLEYAQNGTLPETVQTAKSRAESKTGIADMICAELSQHGYQTRKMVGHSEYRIDIGVIDSKHPDQYLLGILLDGPMYAAAKTTRDREIAQLFVLRSLGWKLHRIWTMDWWDDQKKEIDHLLQKLKEVQSETNGKKRKLPTEQNEAAVGKTILSPMENRIAGSIPLTENMQSVKCQPDCIYRAAVLPLRPMTAEEYLQPQATRYIKENILKVLEQEAPISEGLLLRRIMQSVNIARAGSRMQGRTYSVISSLNLVYTDTNGQRYFWSDVQNPESYSMFRVNGEGENKRDAKDLPKQETANAVYEVLRQEVGIPKEDLVRETAKLFGYTRLGNNVLSAMEAGIQYGLQKKKIIESNNGNFTLKDD